MLVVGGCAMYLSWGAWGVFVACSALTLVGETDDLRGGCKLCVVVEVGSPVPLQLLDVPLY